MPKITDIYPKQFGRFKSVVNSGGYAKGFLVTGRAGSGARRFAEEMASLLLCERQTDCGKCAICLTRDHPDKVAVAPGAGGSIGIKEVQDLTASLSKTAFSARLKVGLVLDAHEMTDEAANALLKTLEEPTESTVIILSADDKKLLPGTIVSRCQATRLPAVTPQELRSLYQDIENGEVLAGLAGGRPELLLELAENPQRAQDYKRMAEMFIALPGQKLTGRLKVVDQLADENIKTFMEVGISVLRDLLLTFNGYEDGITFKHMKNNLRQLSFTIDAGWLVRQLTQMQRQLNRLNSNANPRLVLEAAVLEL